MKKTPAHLKKRGRPSKYSVAIADEICRGLSGGLTLSVVCAALKINPDSVYTWLLRDADFSEKYTRAREIQADVLAEQILSIADDDSKDLSGVLEIPNSAAVNRSRLQVDARKWFASKVAPKKYGDKIAAVGPDGEGPIEVIVRKIGSSKSV